MMKVFCSFLQTQVIHTYIYKVIQFSKRYLYIFACILRVIQRSYYTTNGATDNSVLLYIHNLQQAVIPEKLIGMQGQGSYLFMLSYVLEGKAIIIALLWPAEILMASKECQNPQVLLPPSPLSKTCYRYMVNSKIIQTWTCLKANRIHGTLHTLTKPPSSADGGN